MLPSDWIISDTQSRNSSLTSWSNRWPRCRQAPSDQPINLKYWLTTFHTTKIKLLELNAEFCTFQLPKAQSVQSHPWQVSPKHLQQHPKQTAPLLNTAKTRGRKEKTLTFWGSNDSDRPRSSSASHIWAICHTKSRPSPYLRCELQPGKTVQNWMRREVTSFSTLASSSNNEHRPDGTAPELRMSWQTTWGRYSIGFPQSSSDMNCFVLAARVG